MLNYKLLKEVQAGFSKKAYVDPQMLGGAPMDPAAGGAPMDPAMGGAPMDPSMGGAPMDPAMGGMPMDPAAGGAPMDPAMGGMPPAPPPGLDPAMAGMIGGGMPPPGMPPAPEGATITCTLDDLAKFMQKVLAIKNSGGIEQPQQAPANNDMAEIRQALTQIAAQMGNGGAIA